MSPKSIESIFSVPAILIDTFTKTVQTPHWSMLLLRTALSPHMVTELQDVTESEALENVADGSHGVVTSQKVLFAQLFNTLMQKTSRFSVEKHGQMYTQTQFLEGLLSAFDIYVDTHGLEQMNLLNFEPEKLLPIFHENKEIATRDFEIIKLKENLQQLRVDQVRQFQMIHKVQTEKNQMTAQLAYVIAQRNHEFAVRQMALGGACEQYLMAVTERVTNEVTARVTNEVTARVTNEVTERVTNEVTARVTNEVTARVTNEVTARVTNEVTARVTNEVTARVTNEVTARVTNEVTARVTAKVSQQFFNTFSWRLTKPVRPVVRMVKKLLGKPIGPLPWDLPPLVKEASHESNEIRGYIERRDDNQTEYNLQNNVAQSNQNETLPLPLPLQEMYEPALPLLPPKPWEVATRWCDEAIWNTSPIGADRPWLDAPYFNRNDYVTWIQRFDTLSEDNCQNLSIKYKKIPNPVVFSIVLFITCESIARAKQSIVSVVSQIYSNWQLLIVANATTAIQTWHDLQSMYQHEKRITWIHLADKDKTTEDSGAKNCVQDLESICQEFARALPKITENSYGQWISPLYSGEILREHCLLTWFEYINDNPLSNLLYSDEDCIDSKQQRHNHYFKPDFSWNLLYSHHVFGTHVVYRKAILVETFFHRTQRNEPLMDDYDVSLSFCHEAAAQGIMHIPKILKHRPVEVFHDDYGSLKPWVRAEHFKTLNHFFEIYQLQLSASYTGNCLRIQENLPNPLPRVSIIIPTKNNHVLLKNCIESIQQKSSYPNYEIIIIDNASDDKDLIEYLHELDNQNTQLSRIKIMRDNSPYNYARLNNRAVEFSRGEFICLLNDDTQIISPNWLEEMLTWACQENVGAVGAMLLYADYSVQHAGVTLGVGTGAGHTHRFTSSSSLGYKGRLGYAHTCSAVTGACLMVQKVLYQKVNGLDEVNLSVTYNDVDFCLRLKEKGYATVWTPFAQLFHFESSTRGQDLVAEKQLRFEDEVAYANKRWGNALKTDPYYNPNLSIDTEDYSLNWNL